MLPMFPRRPILLGGLIAPVLWSALVHTFIEVIDPLLNRQIDWVWFVLSQVGFGIVAGINSVPNRSAYELAASSLCSPRGARGTGSRRREEWRQGPVMNCANPRSAVAIIVLSWASPATVHPVALQQTQPLSRPIKCDLQCALQAELCRMSRLGRQRRSSHRVGQSRFSLNCRRHRHSPHRRTWSYPALRCPPLRRLQVACSRQTDRCPVRGIRTWAKPDNSAGYDSATLYSRGPWRSATRRRCLSNLLLLLSWSGRPRREEGQLDCRRLLPRSGE